jgi:hypothetical protein
VAKVRFRAAEALVRAGDQAAVPVLIALLGEGPLPLGWRAERLLALVAGPHGPAVALQGTPASRRQCRAAWERWWKANESRVDLARVPWARPPRPLTLYTELDNGRIVALDPGWKERWHIDDLEGPVDVQLLPSGRLLVAENHGQRVTERDRNGQVVWEKKTRSYPVGCWRLDTGNTFVVTRDGLLEVTPEGKIAWSRAWPDAIWCGRRLRGGGVAFLTAEKQLVYLSTSRTEVRRIDLDSPIGSWTTFTLLPNGHYLVPGFSNNFDVTEFDRAGGKVWEYRAYKAIAAARLPNGHTVITDSDEKRLIEVDRAGKVVRERKTQGRPWHVQFIP